MTDLDFLEIGTSDFDTLYQSCRKEDIGISVEPLKCYLDNLKGKPNVKKINCAISKDNIEKDSTIFYIPKKIIDTHQLPFWLLGCNCIDSYHPAHVHLKIEHLVEKTIVHEIPISKLLEDNNIRSIKLLKLDTEGSDCKILMHLSSYLKTKDFSFYPQRILFETNSLSLSDEVKLVIETFASLGYTTTYSNDNTLLEFNGNVEQW